MSIDTPTAGTFSDATPGLARREIAASDPIPLVIDLDGTLISTDLLYESVLDAVASHGLGVVKGLGRALASRQALKQHFAGLSTIDYANLPYEHNVLNLAEAARAAGRKVYLATASHHTHADGIAAALGIFDGVFASDEETNLSGAAKAKVLVDAFGEGGFDYVGNGASDLPVWTRARHAIAVNLSPRVDRRLLALRPGREVLPTRSFDWRSLRKALRPHQYAKNLLVFVPLLTAHAFNPMAVGQAVLAFLAFCACASAVYVFNDLLDLQSDRDHPTKKQRPFAAGKLPIELGIALIPLLTLLAFALAWLVSPAFAGVLLAYYGLTNLYSLNLKRRMVLDVVALALLYTVRVFGGAVAIDVVISEWLFTFSLLMFTALALVKRYIELNTRLDRGMDDPSNRNYRITDLPVIAGLAAAAGMNSIMVLALYVSSADVQEMYSRPIVLWGLCPLFLYWVARLVMLAHRRMVDDDPIAFAIKDNRSWVVGALAIVLVAAAL